MEQVSDRWRFIKSINHVKDDLSDDEALETDYNPYFINRSMSYHRDTVQHAFVMDKAHDLPLRLQYLFYLNTVKKGKRFAETIKLGKDDDLLLVQNYYKLSTQKAREVLAILTKEQLQVLKQKSNHGGEKRGNG